MDEQSGSNIVEVGVDLSEFYMSVEWDILEVPAVRYVLNIWMKIKFSIMILGWCDKLVIGVNSICKRKAFAQKDDN